MRRKKKQIIIITSVILIPAVMYLLLVNFLVSAALVPSFMRKLEAFERITEDSYAAQVQSEDIKTSRRESLDAAAEWFRTVDRQKLSARTKDGYTLIAEEFLQEEDGPWVLLLHGYTGWKEEMYPFAYWYHTNGYHVVAPDLRCQGESEGDFIGMGWTDHDDCMLWIY